jgi:hypothetical protein
MPGPLLLLGPNYLMERGLGATCILFFFHPVVRTYHLYKETGIAARLRLPGRGYARKFKETSPQ